MGRGKGGLERRVRSRVRSCGMGKTLERILLLMLFAGLSKGIEIRREILPSSLR